ncbi:hypothetical protein Tco_0431052 [Tanacetum coccineum]
MRRNHQSKSLMDSPQILPSVHPTCNSGNENSFTYDSKPNFVDDSPNPLQYTINHPILNAQNEFLNSQNKLMEQMTSICDMVGQIMQKKEEERRIMEEQAAKDRYWKIPICYDDDEDYTIAITPVLSTKEPVDSLIMEDEHLDTIPSVENLDPIPSEFEGISEDTCDVPVCEDPSIFYASSNHSEILSDYSTSSDDDSYENIEYVDATPPNLELVSLEEVEDVKPDQGGLTSIVISDNSNDPLLELPEFESFHFDLDPSFPRPPPEPPNVEINLIIKTNAPEINNVDELNEEKCFDPGGGEINVEDDDSFTFVIRIFLPFLTYPEVSSLLSSTKNEGRWHLIGMELSCTDIAKKYKKTVKTGQTRTLERKENTRSGRMLSKHNSSIKGQRGRVIHHQGFSLVETHKKGHGGIVRSTRGANDNVVTIMSSKSSTKKTSRPDTYRNVPTLANPYAPQSNLTAQRWYPIIARIQGTGLMGAYNRLRT